MRKLLVINGSPKPVSDTMVLTRAFVRGMEQCGEETEIIHVINRKIGPCLGCFQCMRRGDGHCVQRDDQNELLDRLVEADDLLFSFPLYAYAMPSHLKAVVDRLLPLSRMTMHEENDAVRHDTLMDMSRKRIMVISGCGFPDWERNFAALRIMCANCFPRATVVCVPEAPMLNVPEARSVTQPLCEAFTQAGVEFATNGTLRRETVARLETPMIPRETYLAIVNGSA
ncbi:MAG: flavodoxin family protein [bacterium]|nr:flavodoxin family protein [bacterium]